MCRACFRVVQVTRRVFPYEAIPWCGMLPQKIPTLMARGTSINSFEGLRRRGWPKGFLDRPYIKGLGISKKCQQNTDR